MPKPSNCSYPDCTPSDVVEGKCCGWAESGEGEVTEQQIEAKARELYEESRKKVSGRSAWEKLDPTDRYEMGMRDTAITKARAALGVPLAG